jgi:HAD superfamily hydrolase (TIGR01509 family)
MTLIRNVAERLGVDPTRCVAIEDSLPGVVSAKAANMRVIAVPDQVVC